MSHQPIYGFPCVSDPHDFDPDCECCSPEEIACWQQACRTYGKPEHQPNKGCFTEHDADGQFVKHVTRTSWGIGVNLIRHCDECGEPVWNDFIECHDCHRDFCDVCWAKHAEADEP